MNYQKTERVHPCTGCHYWRDMFVCYGCHYMVVTGEPRGCPAGENCTRYCPIDKKELRREQSKNFLGVYYLFPSDTDSIDSVY